MKKKEKKAAFVYRHFHSTLLSYFFSIAHRSSNITHPVARKHVDRHCQPSWLSGSQQFGQFKKLNCLNMAKNLILGEFSLHYRIELSQNR